MSKIKAKYILFGTGTDQVHGRLIPANFTPTYYTPTQVASEGTDKLSAHFNGIDQYLSGVASGVTSADSWQTFTPVLKGSTSDPTVGTVYGRYRRIGDSIEIICEFSDFSTVGDGTFYVALPNSLTVDTAKISDNSVLGDGYVQDDTYRMSVNPVSYSSGTGIGFTYSDASASVSSATQAWDDATGRLAFRAMVPVAEWDSGLIIVSTSQEFSSNSDTSDADDTSSYVNSAIGSSFPGNLTADRYKEVQFQNDIQREEVIILEIVHDNYVSQNLVEVYPRINTGTANYGCWWVPTSANTIRVYFGSAGADDDTNWADIAGTKKWRVRKSKTPNSLGLDSSVARASVGDISETIFLMSNNQASAADVTDLAFANGSVRSFRAFVSIEIDADTDLFEVVTLTGVQSSSSWLMTVDAVGDDSLVDFSITTSGQVQYTSGNYTNFVSGSLKFRAETTSI